MDSTLRPVLKRQILFVGISLAVGILLSIFIDPLVGLAANIGIFVAAVMYIRWRQRKALSAFGFSDESAGRGHASDSVKLKYACLSCGAEVKGVKCKSCGSSMKKPLF
ncbi:MAG: hypothetical protein ABI347_04255 [Nitrososphaera sp.]|jgi:hypothetical protein